MAGPTPEQLQEALQAAHPNDPANPLLGPAPAGWWYYSTPATIRQGMGGFTLRCGNTTVTAFLTPDQFDDLAKTATTGAEQLRAALEGQAPPSAAGPRLLIPDGVPDPRLDAMLRRGKGLQP